MKLGILINFVITVGIPLLLETIIIRYTDNTRSHTQRYRNLQKGIGVSTQYHFIDVELLTFSYMRNVFPL